IRASGSFSGPVTTSTGSHPPVARAFTIRERKVAPFRRRSAFGDPMRVDLPAARTTPAYKPMRVKRSGKIRMARGSTPRASAGTELRMFLPVYQYGTPARGGQRRDAEGQSAV